MKRAFAAFALLLASCKSHPEAVSAPPSASAAPPPAPASALGSAVPAPESSSASAGSAEPKLSGIRLVETAKLEKLVREPGGHWVAELERSPPARVRVVLATNTAPLAARRCGAYFRIAERVAPGLVAPTALRSFRVRDLANAADAPTRARIEKEARVLADGTIEVALMLAPAPTLEKVAISNLVEGEPAWKWETELSSKEPPAEAEQITLSRYQSLLAADYLAQDLVRKFVYLHQKSGRITVAEENEAFSTEPADGAIKDDIERLSRHLVFSKRLHERLTTLQREKLESALRWGDPPTLLITPKQLDELEDHARAVLRVIDQRIKQRGEDKVLILP